MFNTPIVAKIQKKLEQNFCHPLSASKSKALALRLKTTKI
jgi:hypothetical protein